MKNWAGSFSSDTAAANHLSTAGVPITSVTRGGVIHHYRMEHVWVEAAVDYYPSRAARNFDADSWQVVEASFKQYDEVQGMDLNAIAPFDAYAFVPSKCPTIRSHKI